ncbi:hypothetical protein [Bermanella sp. R86510]|uniref:hypothetical protein n=1 Tax=unclassified Bermanella TaxID=2627862 RepID=UPI0037C7567F
MKFKTAVLTSAMVCAVSVPAHAGFYFGIGGSGGSVTETYEGPSTIEDEYEYDQTQGDIKLGLLFESETRMEVSFNAITVEDDFGGEAEYSGIDFDWYFPFGSHNIKPYLGLGFGLYEYEDTAVLFTDGENLGGISINFLAGVMIPFNESVELSLGYEAKGIGWETMQANGQEVEASSSVSSVGFGLLFKF